MTSEQIIQKLLDNNKITVKEAMIILKDLAKIGIQRVLPDSWIDQGDSIKPRIPDNIVVMYGVQTNPFTYTTNTGNSYAVSSDKGEVKNETEC